MKRKRRAVLAALLTGAILAAAPGAAWAKGGGLETVAEAYMPGDQAAAQGIFGPGAYEGRVKDGPFFAYLIPSGKRFPKPGPIPAYAISLGQIVIREASGHLCCWVARVEFTVPTVPRGLYQLNYCNDPCTVDGLGDLSPWSFYIGVTDYEAHLLRRIQTLTHRLEGRILHQRATVQELQKQVDGLESVRAEREALEARVGELQGRLADARSMAQDQRPLIPWAILAIVVALVTLAATLLRRRNDRS